MKNLINRFVFFVGWLLSPFTFWNDAFINIPLSYIAASILFRFVRVRFVLLVLVCYWLSNLTGIAMMYVSGKTMLRVGRGIVREAASLFITILAYSAILIFLSKTKILKPI